MARRVFFSFHYKYVWKVNQIRSMPNIIGTAAAGFQDASLWEEAKKSDKEIKRIINKGLENTSVTVVSSPKILVACARDRLFVALTFTSLLRVEVDTYQCY